MEKKSFRLPRVEDFPPAPGSAPSRVFSPNMVVNTLEPPSPEEKAEEEARFLAQFNRAKAEIEAEARGDESTGSPVGAGSARVEIDVPLSLLKSSPLNPRGAPITESSLQRMVTAIVAAGGVQSAIHVVADGDHFIIADGHRRVAASHRLNFKTVRAVVHPPMEDALGLYKLGFELSDSSERPGDLDNALIWKKLLDQRLIDSQDRLAEITGYSKSYISKVLSYNRLPAEILDIVNDHREQFPVKIAYELALIVSQYGPEEGIAWARRIAETGVSLAALRRAKERKIQSRHTRESVKRAVMLGNTLLGIVNWTPKRTTLEIPDLSLAEMDALADAVSTVLRAREKSLRTEALTGTADLEQKGSPSDSQEIVSVSPGKLKQEDQVPL
ncbi:ParB/RepB/Spo0J family partition protein [Thiomonas sp.]